MRKFLPAMLLTCAALTACAPTPSLNACAGWGKLTPQAPTAATIITTDRPFANQVAAHNDHGTRQGCWK